MTDLKSLNTSGILNFFPMQNNEFLTNTSESATETMKFMQDILVNGIKKENFEYICSAINYQIIPNNTVFVSKYTKSVSKTEKKANTNGKEKDKHNYKVLKDRWWVGQLLRKGEFASERRGIDRNTMQCVRLKFITWKPYNINNEETSKLWKQKQEQEHPIPDYNNNNSNIGKYNSFDENDRIIINELLPDANPSLRTGPGIIIDHDVKNSDENTETQDTTNTNHTSVENGKIILFGELNALIGLSLMHNSNFDNILRLYCYNLNIDNFDNKSHYYNAMLVYENVAYGQLTHFLSVAENKSFNDSLIKRILNQILNGLNVIHNILKLRFFFWLGFTKPG